MADQPTISTATVHAELVRLRSGDGLSLARLESEAPTILALPVTGFELERLGLGEDERHLAAYEALKCTVLRRINNADWRKCLWYSLNIDHELHMNLTSRRHEVCQRFYISKGAYDRMEEKAFRELSAVLRLLDSSVCGEDEDPEPGLQGDEPLERVMAFLEDERSRARRLRFLAMVIEQLPAAERALSRRGIRTSPEQMSLVVRAVALEAGSQGVGQLRVSAETLDRLLGDEYWPNADYRSAMQASRLPGAQRPSGADSWEHYDSVIRVIVVKAVAELGQEIESKGVWGSLFDQVLRQQHDNAVGPD